MRWECLTAGQLAAARDRTGGVCLIPVGSLEKHSDHLPLGNDALMAHAECIEAARREPAVVLPPLYYAQVHQAQNWIGAVAMRTPLLIEWLENICDEAARNGFRKIIIFNMHGGNRYWIPAAITEMGGKGKDYLVMMHNGPWDGGLAELRESDVEEKHAGELEASLALHLHPQLVDTKATPKRAGRAREVPDLMAYTSVSWVAAYPDQYAGDARPASAEKGRKVFEAVVRNLVKTIRLAKRDKVMPRVVARFNRQAQAPLPHKPKRKTR